MEGVMETVAALLTSMSHSTLQGVFGVAGILAFLGFIVGTALYRIKEQMDQENHS